MPAARNLLLAALAVLPALSSFAADPQTIHLRTSPDDKRFDGIGIVDGGGATSVLLRDYPEPQRSQILDLVFKPNFGASVSALLVEIPGDGNSTQGSMPSHMHTRDDLNYDRGYIWWILQQAKARNPNLSLDATAWSAPGWVGNGKFWSQDAADYYVKWLQGLRNTYHLELDAIGCRNEKGYSADFAKALRATLNAHGFAGVKLHAFDHWPKDKFDFAKAFDTDKDFRDSIDILSAHVLLSTPATTDIQPIAAKYHKPIWNTEEHVYKKGFDCEISIVHAFNDNFLRAGATRITNWYDIAALYPLEPYSEDPAMLLAHSPWSGHYDVREALWGYAHYGQFSQIGWHYLHDACGALPAGGTFVTRKSPDGEDYSLILETQNAKTPQALRFELAPGLSTKDLCVWRSDAKEQFIRQADIHPDRGAFSLTLEPETIYSLSTTTGQQKGTFPNIPADKAFPFPYRESFDQYANPVDTGYRPRFFADIAGAFEIADRPDGNGKCLRQVVPIPTISWAPDWQPYTILGDDRWTDYQVSADVYLRPGDAAGVMGRINNVGTGYGFIPKGYFLELNDAGNCRLVAIRGKPDKKKPTGDAEQQALIKAGKDDSEGGEKVLASTSLPSIQPNSWHSLSLRFKGTTLSASVDGHEVLSATDALYGHGMAGLLATQSSGKTSTSSFDNVAITP
jgi:galactosylceramidase